jgi:hypothetical protein
VEELEPNHLLKVPEGNKTQSPPLPSVAWFALALQIQGLNGLCFHIF